MVRNFKQRKEFYIMEKYYSAKEAAEEFDLSEKTLKDWLRAGKLKGEKFGRAWRIADSVLREYLKLPESEDKVFTEDDLRFAILDLQGNLLDIEKNGKGSIRRSEALRYAAMLEDVIEEIEGNHPAGIGGGKAKASSVLNVRSVTGGITKANEFYTVEEMINKIVYALIINADNWDSTYLTESLDLLNNYLEKLKTDTSISSSILPKIMRYLENLIYSCSQYFEKKEQKKYISFKDSYLLASEFRSFEESLPPKIKKMKIVSRVI